MRELLETVAGAHTASGHCCGLCCLLIKGHDGFFLVRLAHECKVKVSCDFVKV